MPVSSGHSITAGALQPASDDSKATIDDKMPCPLTAINFDSHSIDNQCINDNLRSANDLVMYSRFV